MGPFCFLIALCVFHLTFDDMRFRCVLMLSIWVVMFSRVFSISRRNLWADLTFFLIDVFSSSWVT